VDEDEENCRAMFSMDDMSSSSISHNLALKSIEKSMLLLLLSCYCQLVECVLCAPLAAAILPAAVAIFFCFEKPFLCVSVERVAVEDVVYYYYI
jgi:hypothetical protein